MLIADHITPKMLGGTDETSNGQTFCFFDNLKYGWRSRYKTQSERQRETVFAAVSEGTDSPDRV
jgi:hypothetical protein